MRPPFQRFTRRETLRTLPKRLSIGLVVRGVSRGGPVRPSPITVKRFDEPLAQRSRGAWVFALQARGQVLVGDIPLLVLLAALDQCAIAEDILRGLVQRLGTVDDHEQGTLADESAADQILEQPLARPRVLGGAFPQAQDVLVAALVDAERRQHYVIVEVDAVDHQHGQPQPGQIAVQQIGQPLLGAAHEAAADRTLALAPLRQWRRRCSSELE